MIKCAISAGTDSQRLFLLGALTPEHMSVMLPEVKSLALDREVSTPVRIKAVEVSAEHSCAACLQDGCHTGGWRVVQFRGNTGTYECS